VLTNVEHVSAIHTHHVYKTPKVQSTRGNAVGFDQGENEKLG
jgi:hypothetical protein